jgi:hypothetical protein
MAGRSTRSPHPDASGAFTAIAAAAAVVSVSIAWAADLLRMLPIVMGVTMMIALVVGLPILITLRNRGGISWRSVAKGGLITGGIVPALLSPLALAQFVTHGASGRDWIGLVEFVGVPGLAGILGAFLTWGLVYWLSAGQLSRLHHWGRIGLLAALTVGAIFGGAAVPNLFIDRSCHNPLRDGSQSIGPVAGFAVRLPTRDWPALASQLERFAKAGHWSYQVDIRQDYPSFYASLCTEPGTEFQALYLQNESQGILITVQQPQGGGSWRAPFQALQRRLEARWPGSIMYGIPGDGVPPPPWPLGPRTTDGETPAVNPTANSLRKAPSSASR